MRRFFDKQRFNKILAAILVCCMVVGSLGMNELFVNAEDIIYPAGVPTVATNGFSSGTDIVEDGVQQGVQVSFAANGYKRAQSKWTARQLSDGYRVDVEDFAIAENDSMILVMGPTSAGDYIDSTTGTYGIIYEYDGDFVVIAASAGGNLMSAGVVQSATKLAAQSEIDKLSIYIKSDGTKWDIVVDTYKDGVKVGVSYSTSVTSTLTKTYFNFGAVGYVTITDSSTATITGWTNKSEASYMVSYTGIPVQSVNLNKTELTLAEGVTEMLQATVSPTTATNQAVSWSSDNEDCVTVDKNGNVTAKATTTEAVKVIATAADGKTATCNVTVVPESSIIYPAGVPVAETNGLDTNKTNATYVDVVEGGVQQGVQLSFVANGYARVRSQYIARQLSEGYCMDVENFAMAENESMILVMGPTSAGDYIDSTTGTYGIIYEYDGDFVVMAASSGGNLMSGGVVQSATKLAAQNEIDKLSIRIKSDGAKWDIKVVTYKDGVKVGDTYTTSIVSTLTETYFTFGAIGYTTITDATTATITGWTNKSAASYMVSYMAPAVTSVSLNKEFTSMIVGEKINLTSTVYPSVSSQYVTWTSVDDSIAIVNESGQVTAVKAGTTIVTASSKADASKVASCVVKVTAPSEYLTVDDVASTKSYAPTTANVEQGVKVTYTADTAAYSRLETLYDSVETNNYPLKYNGFHLDGNGVHTGIKDIELTNDTDSIAMFIGRRDYSTYDSMWFDAGDGTNGGAYMMFYGKDGSFAIVETYQNWTNNYIKKVLISEKREVLGDMLSIDIRQEDGRYEILVNGKCYSVPAEGDDCPINRTNSTDRIWFAYGLVPEFNVTSAGVMGGPAFKDFTSYSDATFTITDISYITTEELATADYVQRTSVMNLDGNYVIGKNELATTTTFGIADFNGTLDDSREDLVWEIATVDNGYSVKVADGDENSYLNISSTGVSLGAMQVLAIEHVSNTTTSYFTVSDGTNYVNIAGSGVTSSTLADKLILYNVRPELADATTEKPLFTLSTFADLHSERKYTNGTEEYIRDGIVEATQKVREQENANVIAFLGDLISNKSYDADNNKGFWLGTGEDIEEQWTTARDKMYEAAMYATESGRALFLTGNHDYAIGSLDTSNIFNSGDYTSGIESKLPELTDENAYFQSEWPEGTPDEIKNAGHVLAYHYNIDGMDLISINTTYTGTEITSGWTYDAEALDWMGSKLESIGKDKTVIVLGHYPTSSLKTGDEAAYEKITGIFEQYPNVIYLYGHNHNPYIHTDTYQRVQTYAADGTVFQNRYETPTGYIEAFAGSVAFTNDVGLDSTEITGTPAVVQGLIVKVYNDRIVLQMKNYGEAPLGVENLREYTIMRDVELNVDENPQAAKTVEYTTAFPNFRAGEEMEAPIAPVGYVFAGWYYDEACTSSPAASATKVLAEGTKVYAKFVPEIVLSVNAQTRYTTEGETNKIDLRLVTTVDSWDYREVGFIVTNRAGVPKTYPQQYVFASLLAAGYTKTPREINECSIRFGTINIIGITVSGEGVDPNREIPVQAYWITKDGTTVCGPARTIKVSDAVAILENMN